jgi:hypothetical protein
MSLGATAEMWRICSIGEGSLYRTVCPVFLPTSHLTLLPIFYFILLVYFLPRRARADNLSVILYSPIAMIRATALSGSHSLGKSTSIRR